MGHPECSAKEQRQEVNHLQKTFSEKEINEYSGRTEMPMEERGGPRHPLGDLGRPVEKASELTLLTG